MKLSKSPVNTTEARQNITQWLLVMLLIFLAMIKYTNASNGDSTIVQQQKAPVYVLHLVEKGENLWDISTRYGASIKSLLSMNGDIEDSTIAPGQVIKVASMPGYVPPNVAPANIPVITSEDVPPGEPEIETANHRVKAGQTLYAISRLHQVPLDSLRAWNKLASDTLRAGQVLSVTHAAK